MIDKNKHREILIETFKAFDKFCEIHNIKYFACGGTAIGAVRHKGIIPWDDDIDVCMLRDDYNRFIELKEKCKGTNYNIIDYNDKGYYLPFAKFVDVNTTIWEVKEIPFVIGVFIDVFPLNYVTNSVEINSRIQKKYNNYFYYYVETNKHYNILSLYKTNKFVGIKLYIKNMLLKCIKPILFYRFKKIDNYIKENRNGNFLLNYYTPYKLEKEIFPIEWFQEQIEFPFEDTFIKLPNGYHNYLKQLFGDYMTPPSVEKQISHHNLYFMNLERKIIIDEIRDIKRYGD